jgi:perosamine synthetase
LKENLAISMSSPDISPAEIEAVTGVLRTPCLSIGPCIEALEFELARVAGTRFAVGVSSGTAGLHLAVIAAGLGEGDLAITSPFSFVASANCLLYERAVPVFVDVDEATGCIDPAKVEEAVDMLRDGGSAARKVLPRSMRDRKHAAGALKALLPVDVLYQTADFDPLRSIAAKAGLTIIEDSCEAVGSAYRGHPAGSLGDIAVFAFYPNKQMTMGEGGAIVTDREDWAELARSLRNQGRAPGSTWLQHIRLGYNYRLDELSAALGLAQVRRLPNLIAQRARVAAWYTERLAGLEYLRLPVPAEYASAVSWFIYVVRILPPVNRDAVQERLAAEGIPSRVYFAPLHLQSFYRERFGYEEGDFPVTERLGAQSLALPFSGVMSEEQVDRVCEVLRRGMAV